MATKELLSYFFSCIIYSTSEEMKHLPPPITTQENSDLNKEIHL